MYVQIPANGFYFVLGMICGIILIIWLFYILAKNNEKKQKEKISDLFENIVKLNSEDDDKKDK